MFKRILVGVDGHDGGRDAIALAQALREPDCALTLAHVFLAYRDIYDSAYERLQRERAYLLLETARAGAEIDASLRCISSRSAGRGLRRLARVEATDLLVVGSSRRGLLGRVVLGSETQSALQGAACAVAIAPSGYAGEPKSVRHIGVGYDGSAGSRRGLEFAAVLAGELGASVSAFKALPTRRAASGMRQPPVSEDIDPSIDAALKEIGSLGVEIGSLGIEAWAGYGEPAEQLAEYSTGVDLLIIGSRGLGPFGRLVHGSTAHRLAKTARCPLLILPHTGRPAEMTRSRVARGAGVAADGEQTPLVRAAG